MLKKWQQFNEGLFLSIKEWEEKIINIIVKEGATNIRENRWMLDTKFGELNVTFDLNNYPTIFMRFEDPEKSKELYGVNQYSGKWNIHESNIEELYRQFRLRINEVKLTPVERAAKKYNI